MEWVILAVLLVAILAFVLYRMQKTQGWPALPGLGAGPTVRGPAPEADEYRVLLTMVLGDREKAERLIDYEQRRAPGASRSRLIQSAIQRLRDDLSR